MLVEDTVRDAVSHVVQAFWIAERQNPTKDEDNKLSILLSRQFQAYKNNDPQQNNKRPFLSLCLAN